MTANRQTPLGELLRRTREDLGFSRAEVARRAGITVNSLAKYERAGDESDAYYPSSQKLASLCNALKLSPLKAMLACMASDERDEYLSVSWENDLLNHPDHQFLHEQYLALCASNRALATIVKLAMTPPDERTDDMAALLDWAKMEAPKLVQLEEAFIERTISWRDGFTGDRGDLGALAYSPAEVRHSFDYAKLKEEKMK